MRKLRIIIPSAIAAAALVVISLSVVLAQENEKGNSDVSRLAIKVAEILGLDVAEVDDALKQSYKELMHEAIQKRLNALVESGRLTQEQAAERFNSIQSKSDGIKAIGKHFFGAMGHHGGWKGHGNITREELGEKFKELRVKKAP